MPTVDPTTTTQLFAYLISLFSPVIVEAFQRDTWKPAQTVLFGLTVSTLIYVGLHFLLGTLTYPVTIEFLSGLVAAFGIQQTGYTVFFKNRNRVVEVPGPNTTTVLSSGPMMVTDGANTSTNTGMQ